MNKIDKLIETVRLLKEDGPIGGAPTNSVGDGGLTSSGQKLAGYDKVMGLVRRRGIIGKGKFPGARKRWSKKKRKS
jgi:hypothetical protein